jgi:hypothetical protein
MREWSPFLPSPVSVLERQAGGSVDCYYDRPVLLASFLDVREYYEDEDEDASQRDG